MELKEMVNYCVKQESSNIENVYADFIHTIGFIRQTPIEQRLDLAFFFLFRPFRGGWVVHRQYRIKNFIVDFLVQTPISKFVIECDGHDFHERTKEQAQKDKSRDRSLQMEGYSVIRFTGSEIYKDPFKCAGEVINLLLKDTNTAT